MVVPSVGAELEPAREIAVKENGMVMTALIAKPTRFAQLFASLPPGMSAETTLHAAYNSIPIARTHNKNPPPDDVATVFNAPVGLAS